MSIHMIVILSPPPDERPDDLVGVQYVAARFGCSVSAVYAKKCGTGKVKPITESPRRFRRADVDAEVRRLIEDAKTPKPSIGLVRRTRKAAAA